MKLRIGLEEHLRPHFAAGMHLKIIGRGQRRLNRSSGQGLAIRYMLKGQAVLRRIARIGEAPNTKIPRIPKGRRRIYRRRVGARGHIFGRIDAKHHRHKIAPAFAFTAALLGTTSHQPVMNIVTPFMRHDAIIDGAIAIHRRGPGHRDRQRLALHLGNQRISIGLANAKRADGHRVGGNRRIVAHRRKAGGDVIHNQHTRGTGLLGALHLGLKGTVPALEQHNPVIDIVNQILAAVVDIGIATVGGIAILTQDQLRRHIERRGSKRRKLMRGRHIDGLNNERGRRYAIPHIHLHTGRLAIGRRTHIGVVGTAIVLSLRQERIALNTSPSKIIGLGIARRLIKTRIVIIVVKPVDIVKQLCDSRADLIVRHIRRLRRVVDAIEGIRPCRRRTQIRAVKAVGRIDIGIGIGVVSRGLRRSRGQPRVGHPAWICVETFHADQCWRDKERI